MADRGREGWQAEVRAFDDVIICSNAQTLPGLIIRRPRLSVDPFAVTSSLLPTVIARALAFLPPFDERRTADKGSEKREREEDERAEEELTSYLSMKRAEVETRKDEEERGAARDFSRHVDDGDMMIMND